jgi:monofunctional biosynthetic peptidoglycan transglycosylase
MPPAAKSKSTTKAARKPPSKSSGRGKRSGGGGKLRWFRRAVVAGIVLFVCFYAFVLLSLFLMKWVTPPTTALQMQRRVESWFDNDPYQKRFRPLPLRQISLQLQHAVVAAEDARFYQHHGFDWKEIQIAVQDDLEDRRQRGASTISQQLVKNLFLTTHGSFLRKGMEFLIVPAEEWILGKDRILELYLNLIEWGPGVYGADAAARYHYKIPAGRINRQQAIRLAAILPSPLKRKPAKMDRYSARIAERMGQMGW